MSSSGNAIYNTVGATISGVTNTLSVTNQSNTASSAARETITVGGGSAGDPTLNFNVSGVTDWEMGIDNSVSDNLTIAQSTALGTKDVWRMDVSGRRTMPLQPAFSAVLSGNDNNVTGDGTIFKIGSGNVFTITFDQGSNFVNTGTFTAPITGRYAFFFNMRFSNVGAAHNAQGVSLTTSSQVIRTSNLNSGVCRTVSIAPNFVMGSASLLVNMTAGDTAAINTQVGGGAKTVGIDGISADTIFSGCLVC